jgi:hypothetical protein
MVAQIAQSPILTSPWQVPIPLKECVNDRVVVYYRENSWVPIKYCYLLKAIELHYRICHQSGKEVFVFPTDLDPNSFS